MEEKDITIFYSWQSDLDKRLNKRLIKHSITDSIKLLEVDLENVNIKLDDSTSNTPGSQNISEVIFRKISECDIFVCDISIINNHLKSENENIRLTPNPNVLVELGYAIAKLGWARIILLVNEVYGKSIELPFDISKHRAILYEITDSKDKSKINNLSSEFRYTIKTIIEQNPPKAIHLAVLDPEKVKRQRDLVTIDIILKNMHFKYFEDFFEAFPRRFHITIIHSLDALNDVTSSSTFHIYNLTLKEKFLSFFESFKSILSFKNRSYFESLNDSKELRYKSNFYIDNNEPYNLMEAKKISFKAQYFNFLNYLKENYIEIEFTAIEDYQNTPLNI